MLRAAELSALFATRSLDGRVVLLTGATAGIGRATTLRLASSGATVVGVARNAGALAELADEVPGFTPHACDISVDADRAELVTRTLAEHGRIDLLVSNVGIGWTGLVEEMTASQIRTLVETNVIGSLDLTRLVLPQMLARGDGDIVLAASGASWFAIPPLTVYSATKYAIEGFAEGLRREVLARGVRVHSIHPGPVATQFAGRSAGARPGEIAGPPRPGPGISPDRVAAAIERAVTRPGAHTVAVPRVLGFTRIVKLPPLRQAVDLVIALNVGRLGQIGRKIAGQAAGPYAE